MNKLSKYIYAQSGYSVKSGDTLSAIAKSNNVPLESLIKDNNITNSDKLSIGQKLVINKPKDDESYSGKLYKIIKGDTLYDISKKYNVGINELKKYNNLNSDKIYENKTLRIPKTLQEQVIVKDKKAVSTFKNNSVVDNEKLIQDYYKSKPDEQYTVLDKKNGKLKIYKGNTLISDINVGTGKNKGDYSTGLGGVKNYYTGAGVYTIADPSEYKQLIDNPYNKKLYGDNIIGYKNENGVIQGSFLHQVPKGNKERELKLEDNNPNNNRFSQGCINCKKKDFESTIKNNVLKNSKLYILPEDDSNFFENKNGKLNFTTNKNKDIRGYNFTYDDKGNYLSNKVRNNSYRDFNIDKNKLESSIFDNRNTTKQYEILKNKKKSLMKDLNLDSDTYDKLARQMMGHIKQETGSGYIKDIGERIGNNLMDLIPLGRHTAENSSRGDLQIRYNQIPKEILKKYNVNSPDDLDDIEKAIPIGMFLKKDGLQQVISKRNKLPNLTRENLTDFVPYQYNQAKLLQDPNTNPKNNKYVKKVLDFANSLKQTGGLKKYIYQQDDYMQSGGLPDRYKKLGFSKANQVKNAPQGDSHKKMVVAKKGDKYKLVKFGYRGMEDYTQHKDKNRRKNYLSRSAGIKNGSGQLTKDDVFSPNRWSRRYLWKAQTGGTSDNVTVVENGEYIKDNQGKVGKITNIPSHDDNELIIDGESQYVPKGKAGQGIYNVESVLSASHENRNQSEDTYTQADEEIKIKPEQALQLAEQLNLNIKRLLGSISPSKLMDKLLESREKLIGKYKDIDKEIKSERQANSFISNVSVLNSIPTPEDIYEFVFQNQENSKSGQEEMYAQSGIKLDPAKKGTFKLAASRYGMSMDNLAIDAKENPEKYSGILRKKANFYRNFVMQTGGYNENELEYDEYQIGGLKKSQQDLRDWSNQKWRTNSGKKSSETGERYLPDKAWDSLSASEKTRTNRAKREGGGTGNVVSQPKDIADKIRKFRKAQLGIDEEMYFKSGGSTVNAAGNYTKPEMRKRLFNRIKNQNIMGTKSGDWSGRKAQLLSKKYKSLGGGYKN